mmetsp:Transcript_19701/g.42439  ORF Transcript_19701/g.42439 Transcript_19701/m.42439 type:complete len:306 (+) Transcript_19701:148-1065(+)
MSNMMLKITCTLALAVVVIAAVVNGQNDEQQQLRRLFDSSNSISDNRIDREWLNKFVSDPSSKSNPNHHRAMVEMLIRYGTSHVGKNLSMEDVKDALAIEFLSQVDGRPISIAASDGNLFIGTIGSAYNLEGLNDAGITHIVSAARSARMNYSDQIKYKRVHISGDDNPKETPEEVMDLFLSTCNYIDAAISEGGKVLVHDWEGAGRSGALIIAYVMKSRNITYYRALEAVRKSRSIVSPNTFFNKNLELWEKMLGLGRKEKEVEKHVQRKHDEDSDVEEEDNIMPSAEQMTKVLSKNKFLTISE